MRVKGYIQCESQGSLISKQYLYGIEIGVAGWPHLFRVCVGCRVACSVGWACDKGSIGVLFVGHVH